MHIVNVGGGTQSVLDVVGGGITLRNCVLEGGTSMCVWVSGEDSQLKAEQCRFFSRAGSGLHIVDGAAAELNGCRIDGNGKDGIYLSSGASLDANHAYLCSNVGCNIRVEDGASVDLYRCTMDDSQQQGVHVNGLGTSAHISACTICNNSASNIAVEAGASATLQGGKYCGSKNRKGLRLDGPDTFVMASNIYANNNKEGDVVLEGGARLELRDCDIDTLGASSLGRLVTLSS